MKELKNQTHLGISLANIEYLSEFVENGDNDVNGFTITLSSV